MSQDRRPDGRPLPEPEVESLLHLAGRRPTLQEQTVAPVREAARAAWRQQVRRTARRRRIGIAAAVALPLAAGLSLAVGWLPFLPAVPPPAPRTLATLEIRTGGVFVTKTQGTERNLAAGSVVTTDEAGQAALSLAGGPSVRIDVSSVVRLESAELIALDRGGVYVDSGPVAAGGPPLVINTPLGTVRHLGTQFEVRLVGDVPSAALRVRVREGAVRVEHEGRSHEARAGDELTIASSGEARHAAAPVEGPVWDWVQRTAPPLAIEGATLTAFLDWVSRETGLPWRFSDPAVERASRGIVLHGTIEGLTPEEALSVVLPGCGLRHRRGEQALLLEAAGVP